MCFVESKRGKMTSLLIQQYGLVIVGEKYEKSVFSGGIVLYFQREYLLKYNFLNKNSPYYRILLLSHQI